MWRYVQFSGKYVSTGKEALEERNEEKVKWALKQIYFKGWAYRAEHSHFTDKLEALG